jgi:hypothetical protein
VSLSLGITEHGVAWTLPIASMLKATAAIVILIEFDNFICSAPIERFRCWLDLSLLSIVAGVPTITQQSMRVCTKMRELKHLESNVKQGCHAEMNLFAKR